MDDIEITERAIRLLCQVFSPNQLYWLALRLKTAQQSGWAELKISFINGRPGEIVGGRSDRFSLLRNKEPEDQEIEDDTGRCLKCGGRLEIVRPGKWQCEECE